MAQDNVFGHLMGGQPPAAQPTAPAIPSHIPGRPKAPSQPTPKNPYDIETDQRDYGNKVENQSFDNAGKLRDDFNKLPEVKTYRTAVQMLDQALSTGDGPQADLALTYAFAKAMDPESVVRESEQGMVTNSQPWVQSAVEATKKQFGMDGAGAYTPQARAAIRQQIINSVASRRKIYSQHRTYYDGLAGRYGFDPLEVVGIDDGQAYLDRFKAYDDKRAGGAEDKQATPGATTQAAKGEPLPGHFDERGNPIDTAFAGMAYDAKGEPLGLVGAVTDDSPDAPREEVQRLASLDGSQAGLSGLGTLAKHGITLGLSDEAAGVGGAIASGIRGDFDKIPQSYRDNRDAAQLTVERARQANPYTGAAAELLGGGALPGKAIAGANSLLSAARTGAIAGGIGGFGYGEGAAGSTINALGGAALGAGIGVGGQMAGNALAGFATNRAARAASSVDVADVARAGQAEGVTVNRAMVDPSLANRVTGVDSSLVAGGSVQRGMREVEGQIEGRVQNLGRGGQALDDLAAGDTALRAGERFIEKTGKSAKVKYDRAERLAGDAKVTPRESLSRIDEMLTVLGETPKTNQAEIQFLQGLKSDFSTDLSVGALRRQRTALRKRINNGGLTFGEDESRVLAIMDGAADDIRNGLTAQGKESAAKAFDTADKAYRARMEYISGTLQKIMGKRNSNLPPERAFATLQSMAKGKDAGGLRRFYASLTPDERGDVAATFADQLGKNTKGEFSVAHFLGQSEKMSDSAIRTVFGSEGAQSIANLRTLGKEVNRVTSAMNSRTSKSSVGEDYRSWVLNAVLGGGGGFIADGLTTAGIGTAVTLGAKAGRDMMSARALMSPNIAKWLKQAPRTANPKAINAHFKRLGDVAKLEPALAGEIDILRDSLLKAANDNIGRSAAASEREKQQ